MKTAHTATPWKVSSGSVNNSRWWDITSTNGLPSPCYIGEAKEENAKRIVACVNACEGINPEAVPEMLEALQQAAFAIPTTHGCFEVVRAALLKARQS